MSRYLDRLRLDGRVALVTGGAAGIGLACAEALGEAGARTVIADRDPAMAEAGCAQLKAKGYAAEALVMDVTDSAQVAQVAVGVYAPESGARLPAQAADGAVLAAGAVLADGVYSIQFP